jgi:hypothetical protein
MVHTLKFTAILGDSEFSEDNFELSLDDNLTKSEVAAKINAHLIDWVITAAVNCYWEYSNEEDEQA